MNEMKLKKVFESIALSVEIEPITIKLPLAFSHRYELLSLSFLEEDLSFLLIKEQRSGSIESLIQQAEKISFYRNLSGNAYLTFKGTNFFH